MQSKKSVMLSTSTIAIFILGLISLAVVGGIVYKFYMKGSEYSQEIICRNSVFSRANTLINIKSVETKINLLPLMCKSQEKILEGNKKEILNEIAKYLALCKWQFADGRYISFFTTAKRDEEVCFPCYYLTIKDIKNGEEITKEDIQNFLETKTFYKPKDKEESAKEINYLEYLTSYNGVPMNLIITSKIEKGKTYVIYYMDPQREAGIFSWIDFAKKAGISLALLKVPYGLYLSGLYIVYSLGEEGYEYLVNKANIVDIPAIYLFDVNSRLPTYTKGKFSFESEETCRVIYNFQD